VKTSELLMLQDVWRTAFRQDELTLSFKTQAGAQRARMQLYNAVKQQKAGKDMDDLELVHAAEQMEIVWLGDDRLSFKLQRRDRSDMMQGIAAALGGKVASDYVDPEAAASAERMLKELGGLAVSQPTEQEPSASHEPAPGNIPFYGRRGE
jgi:hypothetical protein